MHPRPEGAYEGDALDTAQRFLQSAYTSVESMLTFLKAARRARGAKQGTNSDSEVDLLRAAIVFAGAGLDSALKQLIRDALPTLVQVSPDARSGLERFAERVATDPKRSAQALLAPSSRSFVLNAYVFELTGSSLQSVEQVKAVASALGVNDRPLVRQIDNLRELFTARNEISHELDLREVESRIVV